jgi:hypothetical protein
VYTEPVVAHAVIRPLGQVLEKFPLAAKELCGVSDGTYVLTGDILWSLELEALGWAKVKESRTTGGLGRNGSNASCASTGSYYSSSS